MATHRPSLALALAAVVSMTVAVTNAAPIYRAVSITQWTAGANITALLAAEQEAILACSSNSVLSAITGVSRWPLNDPGSQGDHVNILDFDSPDAFESYAACVAQQPGRILSTSFVAWKDVVLFPYFGTLASATTITPGTPWAAFLANTTDAPTLLRRYKEITTDISSLLGFKQAGRKTPKVRIPNHMDAAFILSFLKPQGALAVKAYINYPPVEGSSTLPAYANVLSITTALRRILFVPIKIR